MKRLLVIFALFGVVGTAAAFRGGALPGPAGGLSGNLYALLTGAVFTGQNVYSGPAVDMAAAPGEDLTLSASAGGVVRVTGANFWTDGTLVAASTFLVNNNQVSHFRGPIDDDVAYSCNGVSAGNVCIHDNVTAYDTSMLFEIQGTDITGLSMFGCRGSSNAMMGYIGHANASFSVAGYASKMNFVGRSELVSLGRSDNVAANTIGWEVQNFAETTPVSVFGWYGDGSPVVKESSPSALAGDVNDYTACTTGQCRIDSGASPRNITGLGNPGTGKRFVICAVGANALTLKHESASSAAANRFKFAAATDRVIAVDECVSVVYDATTSRWRKLN